MNLKLKSMTLQNFKGCASATYEFDGKNAIISGRNGAGKTTIATAWYWLFADKDYDLHSNPSIRPINVEEYTPRVECVLEVDGREIIVAKVQKCTVKEKDGNKSVSLSNGYEVNAVEYGERDFKKKLLDYGIHIEDFLPMSHPDVFTGQKTTDMRHCLFGMASEVTDKDIASKTDGTSEIAELLSNYSMDEIKAIQNGKLKAIREEYGKNGEILRARINSFESAKVSIDVAELELLRNDIKRKIEENKTNQLVASKQYDEIRKISSEIEKWKCDIDSLKHKSQDKLNADRRELLDKIAEKQREQKSVAAEVGRIDSEMCELKNQIKGFTETFELAKKDYEECKKLKFDENNCICPVCNQSYSDDKKTQMRIDFKRKQQTKMQELVKSGNWVKNTIEDKEKSLVRLEQQLIDFKETYKQISSEIVRLEKKYDVMPTSADITTTKRFQTLQCKIEENSAILKEMAKPDAMLFELKREETELNKQLLEVEKKLTAQEINLKIDDQIAELRDKQKQYEQQKANCEKLLYQTELVSKEKNELLTEEINNNFDIVRWQMFDYQKNGDIKDCCIPLIDGKRFGESVNTGREMLAKLDIIKGLQKFYDMQFPVFVDGAECLSEDTKKRIDMDCQIVYLAVSEDEELKVRV